MVSYSDLQFRANMRLGYSNDEATMVEKTNEFNMYFTPNLTMYKIMESQSGNCGPLARSDWFEKALSQNNRCFTATIIHQNDLIGLNGKFRTFRDIGYCGYA